MRTSALTCQGPPHPGSVNYDTLLWEHERRVARVKQVHTCEIRRCLVPSKDRGMVCKRRAPFPLSEHDYISETGEWGTKRVHPFNSRATNNLTFYITTTRNELRISRTCVTNNASYFFAWSIRSTVNRNAHTITHQSTGHHLSLRYWQSSPPCKDAVRMMQGK